VLEERWAGINRWAEKVAEIRALLDQLVNVVVQCGAEGQRRHVREIRWREA